MTREGGNEHVVGADRLALGEQAGRLGSPKSSTGGIPGQTLCAGADDRSLSIFHAHQAQRQAGRSAADPILDRSVDHHGGRHSMDHGQSRAAHGHEVTGGDQPHAPGGGTGFFWRNSPGGRAATPK